MKKLFVFAALASLVASATAQENYSLWSQSRTYILNTTAAAANVSGNVLNFPLLVRLGAADSAIFTAANKTGADVRFDKLNGAHLRYQIENWDSAGRSAAVWVLMDTVKGNSAAQNVRMRWGKSGSADSSQASMVFDTTAGFKAVWHFNEGTNDTAFDATQNKLNAATVVTSGYTAPMDTVGIIGRARRYGIGGSSTTSGTTGSYFTVPNSASGPLNIPEDANYTVSGWANVNAVGTSRSIASKGNLQYYLELRASGRQWEFSEYQVGTGWEQLLSDTIKASSALEASTNNQWQYMVGVRSGTTAKLYWNGVVVDSTFNVDGGTTSARVTNLNFNIGKNPTTADRFWRGELDEVRVAGVSRSGDWVKLEYENQKAAQSLLIVAGPPTALDYSSDTAAYALGVLITPNVATVTGLVDSFTVVPALPTGLSLNKSTGAITGTPTVVTAAANYVLTAINGFGNAKDTLRLSVVAAPPIINYASSASFLAGAAIAPISPVFTSSVDSFTVAPALPAGLSLNKTTGAISGTPAAASAAASFVITGTNASGTGKDTISITVVASEDYAAGWNRHKTLWLNTSNTGATVAGPVTNFPVLVRFTTTDTVYSQMLSGTADLRFTKANGTTRLPHQVEQWDSAGKSASVWVLVDTVLGNSGSQSIRMHWGRAAAQNLSVGRSVFDTAKGFRAVFHFAEAGDTAFDATQYGFKASPQRTSNTNYNYPTDTAGAIGRGRVFGTGSGASTTSNAAGNYYVVAGSAAPLTFPEGGPFTLSTWVISNATGTSRTFVSKSDRAYSLEFRNTGADWEFAEHNVTAGGWVVSGSPAATAGIGGVTTVAVWTHVMGVRTATASVLYVNGVVQTQATRTDATTTAHITTTDLNIGRSPDGGTNNAARYYWRGLLDEVRVASAARSADWARLEYENQKAAQTLVSQTQPVGIAQGGVNAQVADARLTAKALNGGMVFQVAGAPQGGKIALMDLYGRTIWNGAFPAGKNQVVWNGIAGNGQAVSGGVYLARVTLPGSAGTLEIKVPFAP